MQSTPEVLHHKSTSLPRARERSPEAEALRDAIAHSWSAEHSAFPLLQSDSPAFDTSELVETEIFSAATLLDLCANAMDPATRRACCESLLQDLARDGDPVYFFRSHRLPRDSDSTSLTGLALRAVGALDDERARAMARRMLAHRTPEGLLAVYFDPGGERAARTDEVVTCQVLRFAGTVGVLDHTRADVEQVRAALGKPTRYYPIDVLLLVAARMVRGRGDLDAALGRDLARALRPRLDLPGSSLERACRAAAAFHLGIERVRALEILLTVRDTPPMPEPFFWLGRRASYFGSTALTAGFHLHALASLSTLGGFHA
jgi:hypothetical protein